MSQYKFLNPPSKNMWNTHENADKYGYIDGYNFGRYQIGYNRGFIDAYVENKNLTTAPTTAPTVAPKKGKNRRRRRNRRRNRRKKNKIIKTEKQEALPSAITTTIPNCWNLEWDNDKLFSNLENNKNNENQENNENPEAEKEVPMVQCSKKNSGRWSNSFFKPTISISDLPPLPFRRFAPPAPKSIFKTKKHLFGKLEDDSQENQDTNHVTSVFSEKDVIDLTQDDSDEYTSPPLSPTLKSWSSPSSLSNYMDDIVEINKNDWDEDR